MMISFSAQTHCRCDGCSSHATLGFFVGHGDDPDGEIFLCTGCAQRDLDRNDIEEAIEIHRRVCFERAEEERKMNETLLAWLDYEEQDLEAMAC
jgi:hypothetical protein